MDVERALSVEAAAHEQPERPFLVEETRSLSFAEGAAQVRSRGLASQAAAFRAEVAEPTLETIVSWLAALEQSVPWVPLHPRWTESERERAVARVAASPHLRRDHLAVLFTSGTSGTPKGVLLSRRAFVAAAEASAARLGWREDDRWLLAMPLAHGGGLSVLVRALVARRTVVLSPPGPFEPARFFDVIARCRVTIASLVPTQLARLARTGRSCPASLRAVLLGGAACPPSVLGRATALGYPIHTTYGLTEMCAQVATSSAPVRSADEGVGEPLEGVEVKIVEGRIHVRSRARMDGWIEPSVSPPFDAEGFYDTGDLGHLDAHGRLHVDARREDLIVSGGENVYPAEVERALLAIEGIEAACVVGLADETWGQRVSAAVVSDVPIDEEGLSARLRRELAAFKVPRQIVRLAALPTNAVGKLDRAEVRAQLERSRRSEEPEAR
ncbi:MAG: class I adenylate-forming enzyme family protein [Deltaproteobacteria bacterium]